MTEPTAEDARRIVEATLSETVSDVRRFTTGLQHFVYDVSLAGDRRVVMRMTRPSERRIMGNALTLSYQLRPRGIPLPAVLAADIDGPLPWLLLERLPGLDLGEVVGELSDSHLRTIAEHVAAAHEIVAAMPTAGRFGYSASAEDAPFARWSEVVASHVERSRSRIAAAKVFDLAVVEPVARALSLLTADLDAVASVPFLHDTTTKNVIVTTSGSFSGIVDVDDLCFGDPRYVAALTSVALRANGHSASYATHLVRAARWKEDAVFRLYVAAFALDFMGEQGMRFNDNERETSAEQRARLLDYYAEALAAI